MTVAEIEEIFLEQMPGFYERKEIKTIASIAVQHVCHISKSHYLLHKKADLSLAQETALIRILDELRFGKPLQHVLGEADFYGFRFEVNPAVLIPRAETEELVEWVLNSIRSGISAHNILDIGTGSGCIPIALKKNIPASEISAIDISEAALKVAKQNCQLNGVEINLLQGDILDSKFEISTKFNIIISNPPYITQSEKKEMDINVLNYDPQEALFVPDNDPLIFYQAISNFCINHLTDNGYLFLEINENFGNEVILLLERKGFAAKLKQDMQGKDRMVKAHKR